MPTAEYNEIKAPALQLLADGNPYKISEIFQALRGETTIVFRASALADDVAKTNLTAILQQHGLANVRSL